jgi:hypothetical protein
MIATLLSSGGGLIDLAVGDALGTTTPIEANVRRGGHLALSM